VRGRSIIAAVSVGALALGVTACGGGSSSSGSSSSGISGSTLTIYSSLPLQGASRPQSEDVINGEKLALKQHGGKAGSVKIKYVSLDDSTAQNPGSADDGQTQQNARKAVSDKSTIYYLGDFNSGGTKVSLPILNQAGIPQISPSNTYVGLTTNEAGSEPGEPNKYYPGKAKFGRTYARTVPRDTIQGAAQATIMKEAGCKTVDVWNDKTTYGAGIAKNVIASLKTQGIKVGNQQGTDRNSPNYRSQAGNAKGDCFFWGGVTGENGVQVFKDVASANPTAKLFGPDGVAEEAFTNPKKGGIPTAVGKRVTFTVATLGVKDLPEAGPVLDNYKKTYKVQTVDPYGIYGYETMALALNTLKRAGAKANNRAAVVKALFATKNRKSAIGVYSIDKNGDTSLTDYGVYKIKAGLPEYEKKVVAQK
jgi:branched-chain amino acid transport system substrate-binding protein